jgi:hypothetical protein
MIAERFLPASLGALLLALLGWIAAAAQSPCGGLRINELDYDQPGTDAQEFVELKGTPGVSLTGLELHLVNGLNGSIYHSEPLTGTLPADGYLVLGAVGVPNLDLVLDDGGSNLIQNGAPDGLGVWDALSGTYCDFVNYEGSVPGFSVWPEIGTDTADICGQGNSASLARRESTQPEDSWVSGACASPGDPNLGPTAVKLVAFQARTRRYDPFLGAGFAFAVSVLILLAAKNLRRGRQP